ncbi:MAG TPA: hypothetical protein VMH32_08835 [Burkholderiales bacterium]|nr:hypothetical protein [Burkholderiales bacterium]
MLQELVVSPWYRELADYVARTEVRWAVLVPGVLSVAILVYYAWARRISSRLQLIWILALPVSFYFARWQITSESEQLFIYSAFSMACLLLAFRRIYISPALAYALTFLSLWLVDLTQALCHAIECDIPLDRFYTGVGGGGLRDALFLMPLVTAAAVSYAVARLRSRGERLAEV